MSSNSNQNNIQNDEELINSNEISVKFTDINDEDATLTCHIKSKSANHITLNQIYNTLQKAYDIEPLKYQWQCDVCQINFDMDTWRYNCQQCQYIDICQLCYQSDEKPCIHHNYIYTNQYQKINDQKINDQKT